MPTPGPKVILDSTRTVASSGLIEVVNANEGFISLIFSGMVALATIVYAILTVRLVRETILLRKVETEPVLAVYILPSPVSIMLIDIVVRNFGRAAARNIKWTICADSQALAERGIEIGFLQGVTYLPPGERICAFFGEAVKLLGEPPMEPFEITAGFVDDRGAKHEASFTINPRQYEGLTQVGGNPAHKAADALEKLATIARRITDTERLRVEVRTTREKRAVLRSWLRTRRWSSRITKLPAKAREAVHRLTRGRFR